MELVRPFAHPVYSVLIHPRNVEKLSLKPSFGLSAEYEVDFPG